MKCPAGGDADLIRDTRDIPYTYRREPSCSSSVCTGPPSARPCARSARACPHERTVRADRREALDASLLAVYGVWQREGAVCHLVANRLTDLSPLLGTPTTASRDFCRLALSACLVEFGCLRTRPGRFGCLRTTRSGRSRFP